MHRVSIPREAGEEAPRCGGSDRSGKYEQPATAKAIRMTLARTILVPFTAEKFPPYLLPLRPPPTDSITRVTLLARPSLPKETTRISAANPSGLKRHSQTS